MRKVIFKPVTSKMISHYFKNIFYANSRFNNYKQILSFFHKFSKLNLYIHIYITVRQNTENCPVLWIYFFIRVCKRNYTKVGHEISLHSVIA
jgi:hypothetical protein